MVFGVEVSGLRGLLGVLFLRVRFSFFYSGGGFWIWRVAFRTIGWIRLSIFRSLFSVVVWFIVWRLRVF